MEKNGRPRLLNAELSNNKTTPEAVKVKVGKKAMDLYKNMEVMNDIEILARHEIEFEAYSKRIQIEGRCWEISP